MSKRIVLVLIFSAILFGAAVPYPSLAAESRTVLLDPQTLLPGWQVVTENEKTTVARTDEGYLLQNFGATTFIYNGEFGYRDYDRLVISLKNSDALALRIIPDVTTTANYTFENEQTITALDGVQTVAFSLHYPNFQRVGNFAIRFSTSQPADILLLEISLVKSSWGQKFIQPFQDYFRVAPYSAFTVNVFATPRVFGRSAFIYFLPLFLILVAALFYSPRFQRKALLGLLVLWLVTDARMSYEFLSYQITDYQTWVRPAAGQKTLRTYDDFYDFLNWLKQNLPPSTMAINFRTSDETHFPRIAQYYLYPIMVSHGLDPASVHVVYRQPNMTYSGPGTIISYEQDSFIFVPK